MTPEDPFSFAGKLLDLLRFGAYTSSYKYAVLLAIMDLCVEADRSEGQTTSITTAQLAERVVELYWPQARPWHEGGPLRQNRGGQAAILSEIEQWRTKHAGQSLARARAESPEAFARLTSRVEWKLVQMPLPRLQRFDRRVDPFLFEIGWDESITRGEWASAEFDNRLLLTPITTSHLVRVSTLLRPLIHREWAAMVAAINSLPVHDLERFLFDADTQVDLEPVRGPLLELQAGRCFYCHSHIRKQPQVDHFIPRARHPDHGLDNLVVAHHDCNGSKNDSLAHTEHLLAWASRLDHGRSDLDAIAREQQWPRQPTRTINVVRTLYSQLASDTELWFATGEWRTLVPRERDEAWACLPAG